ncbi:hypothetical protein KCP71_17660 [Salmonella enterica subsp. enterica]|nr:hypothetical protein KCP71_17660 [Salmonella enterica subsp. enterica]
MTAEFVFYPVRAEMKSPTRSMPNTEKRWKIASVTPPAFTTLTLTAENVAGCRAGSSYCIENLK